VRIVKPLIAIAIASLVVVACGGRAAPTQAPAATSADGGGGGGATAGPEATAAGPGETVAGGGGGGGGTGSTANGSAHVELSGPATKSGDYGLVLPASIFGGDQGTTLSYTNEDATDVVAIRLQPDGTAIVSYGGQDLTAPGATCTTTNLNVTGSSASGSFECHDVMVVTAAAATLSGATLKGTFTAHT
jgi:hypothetical protein